MTAPTSERTSQMTELISAREDVLAIPQVGDIISGTILDKGRNAMYVDLGPIGVGVIYGRDLFDDMDTFKSAQLGDTVQAMVERFDNEDDLIELSLRSATEERSWKELRNKLASGEIFETEVLDANKGGLIVRVHGMAGFLPVSQLAPDNYPRVEGGDKNKILDRLRELIGQPLKVKVIGAEQETEKLIVSEKAALSDELSGVLDSLSEGDVISGEVSGVVDFGVFIKFETEGKELEGLVHISELAWQRIDSPSDYVSVGQKVDARVIGVDGLRISLSLKQLQEDPWQHVTDTYAVGKKVEGEILKVTPFGGFVKLDDDIHGLVHISELPDEMQKNPEELLKAGEKKKFTIISLQPTEHRLGLSLRSDATSAKTKDAAETADATTGSSEKKKNDVPEIDDADETPGSSDVKTDETNAAKAEDSDAMRDTEPSTGG